MITGGTGFLGRAIMNRIEQEGWDSEVTVYSRDEYKQDLCKKRFPRAHYVLGDVRNNDMLARVMKDTDIVIHTAAIKYVSESEFNVSECIDVNIEGTRSVVECAAHYGVYRVVFISTDKAVEPVNVYGATKMLCERLVSEAVRWYPETAFTMTRYGNVIGSTGSVMPLFMEQYKKTGRVTITDPVMTRFWLSYDEAVDLVEHALDLQSGMMVIPKARASSIEEVAKAITCDPSKHDYIGIRPGEKRYESLVHAQESVRIERSGKYFYLHPIDGDEVIQGEPFSYVSRTPNSFVDAEELRILMKEATAI